MSRYKYTCPDVIHYRKNQYRALLWSNVFSIAYVTLFFGGLAALANRSKNNRPAPTPVETTE